MSNTVEPGFSYWVTWLEKLTPTCRYPNCRRVNQFTPLTGSVQQHESVAAAMLSSGLSQHAIYKYLRDTGNKEWEYADVNSETLRPGDLDDMDVVAPRDANENEYAIDLEDLYFDVLSPQEVNGQQHDLGDEHSQIVNTFDFDDSIHDVYQHTPRDANEYEYAFDWEDF